MDTKGFKVGDSVVCDSQMIRPVHGYDFEIVGFYKMHAGAGTLVLVKNVYKGHVGLGREEIVDENGKKVTLETDRIYYYFDLSRLKKISIPHSTNEKPVIGKFMYNIPKKGKTGYIEKDKIKINIIKKKVFKVNQNN